ncbi:hypothetical protein Vadar_014826 [Vaccinium darrowii]|uniref:Uncharacterized protein n=1 Tax=Vaccinium darrowii TaxID=229202 RepID=A0ACB7YLQ6_9ERIC|nr:hypothetical protein Vadar_014826 [Vaccinium darrowii]
MEVVNLEVEEMEGVGHVNKKMKKEDGSAAAAAVVRWERFLPTTVLRVLLVEADDSTRQIIAALLRKCSYRVTAVPDGLKAWEVLKGKPQNIDLILTEVELPSISGFALLTLVTEHEICKNIPVIMMSSDDSVGTVYKCMLRGAADFLVKPLRKNELRNLWQHVWRRQALPKGDHGSQNENVGQKKVETTGENDAATNQSSGCMACSQRNKDCSEKGREAQSSCSKPDSEHERGSEENMQDISQPKSSRSPQGDMEIQKHKECAKSTSKLLMPDCKDTVKDANATAKGEDVEAESQRERADINSEANDNNDGLVSCAREAIDLMGGFDDYPNCRFRSLENTSANNVGSSLLLDLSLRRSSPSGSVNQASGERQTLKHSDVSAFSRYIDQALQPLHSSASKQKDHSTNADGQLYGHTTNYNSNTQDLAQSSPKNMLSLATGPSGQSEVAYPCPRKTVAVPIPMSGITFDNLSTPYSSEVSPLFFSQSGLAKVENPCLAHHQELTFQANSFHPYDLETRNSQQFHNLVDQNGNYSTNETEHEKRQKLESLENQRNLSSASGQSGSSSFCTGNGNVDQVAVVQNGTESGNESSHRSVQREVALTKFRLKRKDRCFEKKVRYESRKKLSEQRPRVKGQFVRHVHTEPALLQSESQCCS